MKRALAVLVLLLLAVGVAYAGVWTKTCTFGATDNLCIVDMRSTGARYLDYGNATIFLPALAGRAGTTLTVTLSHDNTTYYTSYAENGDTAIDTYPGDNTVNKAYGLSPLHAAAFWKFTSGTDNVWDNAVIVIQGRD